LKRDGLGQAPSPSETVRTPATGFAHQQAHRQNLLARRLGLALQPADHRLDCEPADIGAGIVDRGQLRRDEAAERDAVEADHRHVLRHAHTVLAQRVQRTDRHLVAVDEDGARTFVLRQQLLHRRKATGEARLRHRDELRVRGDTGFIERRA
jgi:hypothetical protein